MTKTEKKKLNVLLHQLVRLRDGDKCLKCGKRTVLQLSHIYAKGKHTKMAFDSKNVKLLCMSCHLFWWHKDIVEAHEWLEEVVPPERLAYLRDKANTIIKTKLDYKTIKAALEAEIEALK